MLSLVITLVVVGVGLWALNTYVPMDGKIKNLINVVVIIAVVVFLLSAFGMCNHMHDMPVPQIN